MDMRLLGAEEERARGEPAPIWARRSRLNWREAERSDATPRRSYMPSSSSDTDLRMLPGFLRARVTARATSAPRRTGMAA